MEVRLNFIKKRHNYKTNIFFVLFKIKYIENVLKGNRSNTIQLIN